MSHMTKFPTEFDRDFDPVGKQYRLLNTVTDDLDHYQEIVIGTMYCILICIIILNTK